VIAHVCTRAVNGRGPHASPRIVSGPDILDASLRFDDQDLVWIDIIQARNEDIDWLARTFGFHQLALEDVARRHQRAKLDEYPGYYFGVLYAIRVDTVERRATGAELQFFWGPRYLVTIHDEPFPEIDALADRARSGVLGPVVRADTRAVQIPDLVYRLIDSVLDGYFTAVDALAEWLEDLEEGMFSSPHDSAVLQRIFGLRKDVVQLRKLVAPSRDVVNVLLRRDHHLYGDVVRVIDSLDTHRDVLGSALDTYLSIVSNDVNQVVRKMTALATILMLDALIAGIYGMNFVYIPELSWRFGYLWALGLMAASTLGLLAIFKRRRWF
jgi:magnesium transporter